MGRITVIEGHPDPSPERLNHALAERYAAAAAGCGYDVRRISIAQLGLPPLRTAEEFGGTHSGDAIAKAQEDIAWADHLVFFFPMWMLNVPSLFKAFMEQIFRPNFALGNSENGFPKGLLGGKSARLVATMGMPAIVYRAYYGQPMIRSLKQALALAGIAPVATTLLGGVGVATERTRERWLNEMAVLAERDGNHTVQRRRMSPALVSAMLVSGGVVALYSAKVFPRLLDWVMRTPHMAPVRKRIGAVARGRVLEIGIGSGLNLEYYQGRVERLTGVDPSADLLRLAERRARAVSFPVELLRASGEALPLEDESIDTAVTTFSLCTVDDAERTLAEVRRVLKPEGIFVFAEHGRVPDTSGAHWQDRLTPLWRRVAGGCRLNRHPADLVRAAGFRIDRLETTYLRAPRIMGFVYEGVAHR
jgi:putative NADPH-quinone reductase/SAM-dependent methyltransferase